MALKKFKPVTAGTRWRIGNAYAEITTNKPEKSLLETKKEFGWQKLFRPSYHEVQRWWTKTKISSC